MTEYLELAKADLGKEGTVCVIVDSRDGSIYRSNQRGIRPLMDWLEHMPEILKDGSIADRVIGKAAAFLMIYGGIKEVYTELISQPALEILAANGIPCDYEKVVPRVLNRDRTGLCPMESCCLQVHEPEAAFEVLRENLKRMSKQKQ